MAAEDTEEGTIGVAEAAEDTRATITTTTKEAEEEITTSEVTRLLADPKLRCLFQVKCLLASEFIMATSRSHASGALDTAIFKWIRAARFMDRRLCLSLKRWHLCSQ